MKNPQNIPEAKFSRYAITRSSNSSWWPAGVTRGAFQPRRFGPLSPAGTNATCSHELKFDEMPLSALRKRVRKDRPFPLDNLVAEGLPETAHSLLHRGQSLGCFIQLLDRSIEPGDFSLNRHDALFDCSCFAACLSALPTQRVCHFG